MYSHTLRYSHLDSNSDIVRQKGYIIMVLMYIIVFIQTQIFTLGVTQILTGRKGTEYW